MDCTNFVLTTIFSDYILLCHSLFCFCFEYNNIFLLMKFVIISVN